MRFLIAFFFITGFIPTVISQTPKFYLFKETKADAIPHEMDSILILGIGSTPTRIFLDNLSEKIMKSLKRGNVISEYFYLGKTVAEAREDSNLNKTQKYKAVLLFIPQGDEFFELKLEKFTFPVPLAGGMRAQATTFSKRFMYDANFDIRLYTNKDEKKLIWTAIAQIDNELTQTGIYSKLSKRIMYCFKKNKYIR